MCSRGSLTALPPSIPPSLPLIFPRGSTRRRTAFGPGRSCWAVTSTATTFSPPTCGPFPPPSFPPSLSPSFPSSLPSFLLSPRVPVLRLICSCLCQGYAVEDTSLPSLPKPPSLPPSLLPQQRTPRPSLLGRVQSPHRLQPLLRTLDQQARCQVPRLEGEGFFSLPPSLPTSLPCPLCR